jgi:uncharacterized membrane protein
MKLFVSLVYVPVIYFGLRYFGLSVEDVLQLKMIPLLLSVGITGIFFVSWKTNSSFMLNIAKKFKKDIKQKEATYIQHSTLYWSFVCLLNTTTHIFVLISHDSELWLAYSTVGWYGWFVVGGLAQYIHKKSVE